MITDPDTLTASKTKAIKELRDEAARRPERFEHDAFAAMLREDDERVARGEPSQVHDLVRDYLEGFRSRRTPQERAARQTELQDAELAREQAATRWKRWIADPHHVDALIALVGAGPASSAPVADPAPSPSKLIPPWLRKG